MFSGLEEAQEVRVASFFYRNISGFLPESFEEDESDGYVRVSWTRGHVVKVYTLRLDNDGIIYTNLASAYHHNYDHIAFLLCQNIALFLH